MCIYNAVKVEQDKIMAYKVMAKKDHGYRPVFYSGSFDKRLFKIGETYEAEKTHTYATKHLPEAGESFWLQNGDYGFHACKTPEEAQSVKENISRCNYSPDCFVDFFGHFNVSSVSNACVLLVELSGEIYYGNSQSVGPHSFKLPSQYVASHMKIIQEYNKDQ